MDSRGNAHVALAGEERILELNRRENLFLLNFSHKKSLEEAAEGAGWTKERAIRFLRSEKMKALKENILFTRKGASAYWNNVDNWYVEGDTRYKSAIASGKDKLALEYWREFGDRASPKPSREQPDVRPTIQININPQAVEDAFSHHARVKESIDAEFTLENPPT